MFDLVITADYEGQTASSDKKVRGTIKLEDFTSHSDEDEYTFSTTVEGSGSEQANKMIQPVFNERCCYNTSISQDECKRIAEGMKDKLRRSATVLAAVA
eukprot:82381-Chlamydomonas_euryale.AAC.9